MCPRVQAGLLRAACSNVLSGDSAPNVGTDPVGWGVLPTRRSRPVMLVAGPDAPARVGEHGSARPPPSPALLTLGFGASPLISEPIIVNQWDRAVADSLRPSLWVDNDTSAARYAERCATRDWGRVRPVGPMTPLPERLNADVRGECAAAGPGSHAVIAPCSAHSTPSVSRETLTRGTPCRPSRTTHTCAGAPACAVRKEHLR